MALPAFARLRLAAPPSTRNAWNAQRPALLKAMQQVMGPLPGPEKRGPLDVQFGETVDFGTGPARPCKRSIPIAATIFPSPAASGRIALSPRHWGVWDFLTPQRLLVRFTGNSQENEAW